MPPASRMDTFERRLCFVLVDDNNAFLRPLLHLLHCFYTRASILDEHQTQKNTLVTALTPYLSDQIADTTSTYTHTQLSSAAAGSSARLEGQQHVCR